ncbi:Diphthamide biosynthesis protein 4 [Agyrium rufum]|nr:Diphthamide biosynthesis protein 4 [Agyrium rufum]
MSTSPIPPDPYKALGVPKDATITTIRSAHRKLVLKCHPDKVADATAKAKAADEFHQVQQAYEILSDDTRRKHYDDQVKLAELRADIFGDKNRRAQPPADYFQRSNSNFEERGNVIYEERVPRRSPEHENFAAKYDDYRPSAKRYSEKAEFMARRSSAPTSDDRRKARARAEEDERVAAMRERESEKARRDKLRAEGDKRRDRERRKDYERKDYETKHRHAYVEEDSDSDSDVARAPPRRSVPETKRRHEEPKRRSREETRKPIIVEGSDSEDLETKHWNSARNYIFKASNVRPSLANYISKDGRVRVPENAIPPPPPPPPAPAPARKDSRHRDDLDLPRRSSGHSSRREETRPKLSSSSHRRPSAVTEIVEPSSRAYESATRRPGLSSASTDPTQIHIPSSKYGNPPRSSTLDTRKEARIPPLPRSATTPLASMVGGHNTLPMHSKLRAEYATDSDYSSHGEKKPPRTTTKQYVVKGDSSDEGRGGGGRPRVLSVEPENIRTSSDRDISPKSSTKIRPSLRTSATSATTTRGGSSARTASYLPSETMSPASASAAASLRPEFARATSSATASPKMSSAHNRLYREVSYQPPIREENIKYADWTPKTEKRGGDYFGESTRDRHHGISGRGHSKGETVY